MKANRVGTRASESKTAAVQESRQLCVVLFKFFFLWIFSLEAFLGWLCFSHSRLLDLGIASSCTSFANYRLQAFGLRKCIESFNIDSRCDGRETSLVHALLPSPLLPFFAPPPSLLPNQPGVWPLPKFPSTHHDRRVQFAITVGSLESPLHSLTHWYLQNSRLKASRLYAEQTFILESLAPPVQPQHCLG